jgi:hypothetical protein
MMMIPQGLINMELHIVAKPVDAVRTDISAYSGRLVISTVAYLKAQAEEHVFGRGIAAYLSFISRCLSAALV